MNPEVPDSDLSACPRLRSYVSPKAEIRNSPLRGRGMFATGEFRIGEVVYVMGGYVFTRQSSENAGTLFQRSEIQIADNLFIGAIHPDDSMIASNHSCDPNTAVQGQIIFVALREIAPGEELTHDWATTDDADYAIECRCGSAACRRTLPAGIGSRRTYNENIAACFPGTSSRRSNSAMSEPNMAIAEGVLGNDWSESSIRQKAPQASGVYAIYNHAWIYIGESNDIRRTLLEYWNGDDACIATAVPTGFVFEVCNQAERMRRQVALIVRFQPRCNQLTATAGLTVNAGA